MAAVLRAGPGAVLSHRAAASLWGIRRSAPRQAEVIVPHERRSSPGVKARLTQLPTDEVTAVDGIPVTTVPRTLLDLAAVLRPDQLEAAINEAETLRLTDPMSLADLAVRYPGRKGIGALRSILDEGRVGATLLRSELEERFLALVDRFGLPRPRTNEHLEAGGRTFECDCVWHAERLIVELDGRRTHDTGRKFEADRARDRALQAAGWRVVRITWWQLERDASAVARDLRLMLERR